MNYLFPFQCHASVHLHLANSTCRKDSKVRLHHLPGKVRVTGVSQRVPSFLLLIDTLSQRRASEAEIGIRVFHVQKKNFFFKSHRY